ncbi:MAG TPA: hypothetical protein VFJ94_05955 [Intrasporangium sp.]|uniref:hypothetical protein n=1 Tax=Intrasporangium sp. TaxID=1925024 RepID=UPI002D773B76|nr:hypothetical protein [Intrasporangium sp.]HET7398048.1 hypothetical protein [Intrasporangium sp.]
MITVELARRLLAGGVLWEPRPGDRFAIDQPTMAGEVFWISELTIDVHTFHGQPLLGFNGTTEWALDSVTLDAAVWLPREDQLRELLGSRFRRLSWTGSAWTVTLLDDGGPVDFTDADVECAYARALLSLT